uniref:Protein kinase superfamily protein n=1 Tax=Zea mays TaxID=4577 RepID=A0A804NWZ4_MAIZE
MTTKDKSAVSSPDQPASLVRNASMRGMPINGSFRKDNSTESFDLECQEKHLDIVPTSSSPERKFSFSSCSSNGLLLSKERFVLIYRLNKACNLVSSSSMTKVRSKSAKPVLLIRLPCEIALKPAAVFMKVQLDNSTTYSSKQQTSIHNLDKCNGGHLHVSDETSSEAAPKTHKSAEDHDDRSKPPLIRGRFRVIPGHVDSKAQPPGLQKCHSMQTISRLPSLSIPSSAEVASTIIGGSFYMQLYSILQTNMLQRDQILNAMKQVSGCAMASPGVPSMASPCIPSTSRSTSPSGVPSVDRSMLEAAQEREKELLNEVLELQWRLLCTQDEVQKLKAKAAQH